MNAYPNTPQAWDRTQLMARSVGVDLPRAVLDGWLTRRDLDVLVGACSECGQSGCQTLGVNGGCSNKSELEALRF